jgi:hypothetical protein
MLVALAACVLTIAPVGLAAAQEGGADRALETRVRRAALFKNGLAFVVREASVAPGTRNARLDALPVPVHGTFWLAADPAKLAIGPAVARRDELTERVPAATIEQILRANVGRRVTLALDGGEALTGKIVAVPEVQPEPLPYQPARSYVPPYPVYGLVILETEDGTVALGISQVKRVASAGEESLAREFDRPREAVSLSLELTPRGEQPAALSILYVERGLAWAPSYAIDVSNEAEALLTAKAEIINEAEDLEGATVDFVTGFPNLRFSHVIDPIAMQGNLDALLAALGQTAEPPAAVAAQRVMANVPGAADFGEASFPFAGPPAEGEAVGDLFFYEQKGVSLKRGERGLYPLFSVRVPSEHLYQWEIAPVPEPYYPQGNVRPDDEEEEIWHSVRLTNTSSVPWTTAPAMTLEDGRLLGQDRLSYAAVGAKTTVRITRAVDVQGEQAEYEVQRERQAARFDGSSYDRITVRGEVRATNRKRESVRLEITKHVQGEVTKNPDEASVATLAERLRRVNPTQRLTWTIPLEPGAARTLTFEYTVYVPS